RGCERSGGWPSGGGAGGGLANEPTEGMEVEEEVGELDLLRSLGEAIGGQALEAEPLGEAVAALGEVAAAVAGARGIRAAREVAGQAARSVWEGRSDVDDVADRAGWVEERAGHDGLSRRVVRAGRRRVPAAGLGADVLGPAAGVLVAVGAQAVA